MSDQDLLARAAERLQATPPVNWNIKINTSTDPKTAVSFGVERVGRSVLTYRVEAKRTITRADALSLLGKQHYIAERLARQRTDKPEPGCLRRATSADRTRIYSASLASPISTQPEISSSAQKTRSFLSPNAVQRPTHGGSRPTDHEPQGTAGGADSASLGRLYATTDRTLTNRGLRGVHRRCLPIPRLPDERRDTRTSGPRTDHRGRLARTLATLEPRYSGSQRQRHSRIPRTTRYRQPRPESSVGRRRSSATQ